MQFFRNKKIRVSTNSEAMRDLVKYLTKEKEQSFLCSLFYPNYILFDF